MSFKVLIMWLWDLYMHLQLRFLNILKYRVLYLVELSLMNQLQVVF